MRSWRHAFIWLTASMLLATSIAQPAGAEPPGYLLLRRGEAPGSHNRPGYYDAAIFDARTTGYAYGYFGVAPRSHFSRNFGVYRTYTQFAWW